MQTTGSPQIIFSQPEIVSLQTQWIPGSYANITIEDSCNLEEATITIPQTLGAHNTPLVNLWGETITPHTQCSTSPTPSYFHPVMGTYLPLTVGSGAPSSLSRQTLAQEPHRRAIMNFPHLWMPVNCQRIMEENCISTPVREPVIHKIQAPSARSLGSNGHPGELHAQVQQLVNANMLVQQDLRVLQRNYKTTWCEAHTTHTPANNKHGRSQQSLVHMNKLRDQINEVGNQLTVGFLAWSCS